MDRLPPTPPPRERLRLAIQGCVQGVGFRPFAHRLAAELGLHGWIRNDSQGVTLEVEGPTDHLQAFLARLPQEKPPLSFITSLEPSWLPSTGSTEFRILESHEPGPRSALVLPDVATCPECVSEIRDPQNRRFQYPFTNCTRCGPRFSIISALPYDRRNTTMADFQMCPACLAEYGDPANRRFHAEPNACAVCGPQLQLWDAQDHPVQMRYGETGPNRRNVAALDCAAAHLLSGKILALKGIGGFQLLTSAQDDTAVQRLRALKHREEKPFAVMFPDLARVRSVCTVDPLEERVLLGPEAPIVLLQKLPQTSGGLAHQIAPGNRYLGAMLPYSPLHHLLLSRVRVPVVATSGNLSDEPICTDESDAVQSLGGIADFFLVHNRRIVRHVDDSVVQVVLGREMLLRRSRGYAPLPIRVGFRSAGRGPALALGAHLKNTIALSLPPDIFVSQHIGDLETDKAFEAFRRVIQDLEKFYGVRSASFIADLHPEYLSTKFGQAQAAQSGGAPCFQVQHHVAHVLACMAENDVPEPALGVAWDGNGFGFDGSMWGGEFFRIEHGRECRVAHFESFDLPGGEAAFREPRRSALGAMAHVGSSEALWPPALRSAFTENEVQVLRSMLARRLHSVSSSSVGRLFDAVASLVGLRQVASFEGQAAMQVESAAAGVSGGERFPLVLRVPQGPWVVDWKPTFAALLESIRSGVSPEVVCSGFHNALVESILQVAARSGLERVVLSGGCFQNRELLKRCVPALRAQGHQPFWHQRVPPNDGGISLGQVVAAARASV